MQARTDVLLRSVLALAVSLAGAALWVSLGTVLEARPRWRHGHRVRRA